MTELVPGWTDERVDLLRRLWDDGLSASQIASQIGGVSRNAVIGKIHRMGLGGRIKGTGPQGTLRRRERDEAPLEEAAILSSAMDEAATLPEPAALVSHRPAPNFPLAAPLRASERTSEPVALAVSERVTIMDLRDSMCRWPMGDPTSPDFRFCGGRSITGLPYCAQHAQIAYQPAAERKRDRRVAGAR